MGYAAVALALLGLAIGTMCRLSALIVIVAGLFFLSIGLSIFHHLTLLNAILVIMGTQTIVQGSYFLGVVARTLLADRWPQWFKVANATERDRKFRPSPTLRPGSGAANREFKSS
jgi:disulfide bond formation protein DsbB